MFAAAVSIGMSLSALAGAAAAGPLDKSADEVVDPPHPLAARYPDKLVVVCEAGCPRHRGPAIVFTEPVPQRRLAVQGMMQPTSAQLDDALPGAPNVIECVAGCYDTPKFYKASIVPTRPAGLSGTALRSRPPIDAGPRKREPFSPIR